MQLEVFNQEGQAERSIEVSNDIFDAEFNSALVHQVVVAVRAGRRSGTSAQKNRSAVRGGGRKPYRQKGMGRARAGTRSSPINRGGGQTFAASPRDYSQKTNRKSFRVAMRSILSETRRLGNLVVVSDADLKTSKTKDAVQWLANLNCTSVLIVDGNATRHLHLATRNIPSVSVISPSKLNPVDIIDSGKLLMTADAVEFVESWLQ